MKNINKIIGIILITVLMFSCQVDDTPPGISNNPKISGTYMQEDQMGRPAVNTVFVSAASKDMFNTTIPSNQGAAFQSMFEANLTGLSPAYANPGDTNALGLDAATFSSVLATDVLNVSLSGTTTLPGVP